MKDYLKSGKLMTILGLLGLVILFAGCLGPPSEDNPVSGGDNGQVSMGSWKVNVDIDNASVAIDGLGGTGTLAVIDGHSVEVKTGPAGCTWNSGTSTLSCQISYINRDTDETMWDVRTRSNQSTNPAASVGNADYTWTCSPWPSCVEVNTKNTDKPINEAGYCVTESGDFKNLLSPYVKEGCETYVRKALATPWQFIHPRCGTINITQDFKGVSTGQYTFYTDLFASWYPEVPRDLAGNVIDSRWTGTANSYAVNGPENHRTMWIDVSDLTDKAGPPQGYRTWRPGCSYRANITNDAQFAVGKYFAVQVAYEYPDRIERDPDIAVVGCSGSYEYYDNFSFAIIWDDAILGKVAADKLTPGLTQIYTGVVSHCGGYKYGKNPKDHCADKKYNTYKPVGTIATDNNQVGFVSTSQLIPVGNFQTFGDLTGYMTYYWITNTKNLVLVDYVSYVPVTVNAPVNMGHKGLVHIDHGTGAIVHEGVDADIDYIVGLYYLWVKAGTSGKGSFIALQQSPYTNTTMKYTNGTAKDRTNDYQHCYDAATMTYSFGNCSPVAEWTPVSGGSEKANGNLPGGEAIMFSGGSPTGLGGYQMKATHVCVQ